MRNAKRDEEEWGLKGRISHDRRIEGRAKKVTANGTVFRKKIVMVVTLLT